MSNLMNFFFSFDKLMKEKLVIAFFWLVVIRVAMEFAEEVFDNIGLDPIGWLFGFGGFFVYFLMILVGARLLCEVAIAIFRINDNLSPDGGKSETADIDPIREALKAAEEAKRAAEEAAKKATAATRSAVSRNKDEGEDNGKIIDAEIIEPEPAPKAAAAKTAPVKKAPAKKPAAKKSPAKKPAAKTTAAKKPATKKAPAKKAPAKKAASKDDKPQPETD